MAEIDMTDVIGRIYCTPHVALAEALRSHGISVDALITDPPYSARTHSGHDAAASGGRSTMPYAAWGEDDVRELVEAWSPLTRGWMVAMTDHVLAPAWAAAMEAAGRYVFAPVPLVERGSRVRLAGDGPSSWTCWVVVGRPRTPEYARWGTLPGAYVGDVERGRDVVGGKPRWAMRAIVRDYSRRGDVVCDPCCGAGTTLLAAHEAGRRWIGGDVYLERVELARLRLAAAQSQTTLDLGEAP